MVSRQYYRFLRKSIGIKASYYSRTTNREVWIQAGKPVPPSETLSWNQYNTLIEVFKQDRTYPTHGSIFCSAFKGSDTVVAQDCVHLGDLGFVAWGVSGLRYTGLWVMRFRALGV